MMRRQNDRVPARISLKEYEGHVVLAISAFDGEEGIAFGLPVETAKDFAENLIKLISLIEGHHYFLMKGSPMWGGDLHDLT